MILTNQYNIPEIIVRAMGESYPPQVGRVAVTALIDSPLIRYLKIKYWNQLTEDVSDRLWALLGQASHTVVQKGRSHTDQAEEYMKIYVYGMAVTGKSDIIVRNELNEDELIDLKITSVYSFLLGEKDAWNKQLNVYNYMASHLGRKIKSAKIYGILRDWSEMKQYGNSDYPPIPFFNQEIELWPLERTQKYIEDRVNLHIRVDALIHAGVCQEDIYCTPADRWLRSTTYAVMKGKNVKATRVLDSFTEAQQWMIDNGKTDKEFHIEERPGQAVRCERFCVCKPVCPLLYIDH